jgi:hypothetical protein
VETSGCPFVQLSDGRVFDGDEAPINHRESDSVQPGSVTGARLSAVEHLLERHVPSPPMSLIWLGLFRGLSTSWRAGRITGACITTTVPVRPRPTSLPRSC